MPKPSHQNFQIFAKPVSYRCNLGCHYCYYLCKSEQFDLSFQPSLMTDHMLEAYINEHIAACKGDLVNFSWHGGEPLLAGTGFYRRVVEFQKKHNTLGRKITNGIQTNGTLINDEWGAFFAEHNFTVGISIDGPQELHDHYRRTVDDRDTHQSVMQGWKYLRKYTIPTDILCVVNDLNVMYPLQVYRYLKDIGGKYISFLPLVERSVSGSPQDVTERSVQPEAFGAFLCTIFDHWLKHDIGDVKIQVFEEATRTAFKQEHSLCLFRPVCGDIPVLERNGDLYFCDHFVDQQHLIGNITEHQLAELLESASLKALGAAKMNTLPQRCKTCEVLSMCNGECPKNRFVTVPGEDNSINYLCAGYKMFFNHCQPFVDSVAKQWHLQHTDRSQKKTGRNDLCPCGSGKKYKRCCLKL
ncbi:anaerobic sulfatase maturase [Desulfosediminicola flagellatus]|uniref:anaerobic sulfatase maturase n=1 Tax=Desulfosediminicola flagellatus TaxID=2569541 RepID=UPI0010ACAD8D|nr:anaerobic sulfatase maturase [Desulfosediminicola flagellatus]